jgi:hypothetical protein
MTPWTSLSLFLLVGSVIVGVLGKDILFFLGLEIPIKETDKRAGGTTCPEQVLFLTLMLIGQISLESAS